MDELTYKGWKLKKVGKVWKMEYGGMTLKAKNLARAFAAINRWSAERRKGKP